VYQVDDLDRVVELNHAPQASVGAPTPIVIATETGAAIAYYLSDTFDGIPASLTGQDSEDEPVAIIVFRDCYAQMFGPPNDEAFSGHPLFGRGLRPYGAYEVEDSSWLRCLERMNAVQPGHSRSRFVDEKKHFVFAFHDSTFECIAKDLDIEIQRGSVDSIIRRMQKRIGL
jgi:hypothetical protein